MKMRTQEGRSRTTTAGRAEQNRDSQGFIWRRLSPRKPGKGALAKAKSTAVEAFLSSGVVYCPCCRTNYAIASVAQAVSEQGYCGYCALYMTGRDDSIAARRRPTFREVMRQTKAGDGLTAVETQVLLEALAEKKTPGGEGKRPRGMTLAEIINRAVAGRRVTPWGKRKARTIAGVTFTSDPDSCDYWRAIIEYTSGESGGVDFIYDKVN